MDECPRCQRSLEKLTLGEVSTITCPHCEYADIPVEHEPDEEDAESWRDAFNRFYEE
ncbi:zf-TFIIB domain-containing protein [Natronobacterium texcoconense]|uniref:Transcription factor zinc-finger n=1 Tax=Natronobacterium texcoconense TaxID=1095778 RepID=A0A1H1IX36_NATTX|nr:zf-TFIIB domain-containing protein [Natronobacterium texcoconense]SDR41936.1 Transcription factor zinc-finger [Natronobacterium texcoconense]